METIELREPLCTRLPSVDAKNLWRETRKPTRGTVFSNAGRVQQAGKGSFLVSSADDNLDLVRSSRQRVFGLLREWVVVLRPYVREEGRSGMLASADKQATLDQLDGVFARCSSENWDGYSAAPVTPEAHQRARQLILALPESLPLPEVSAEPDGHVALEWYRSPRHTLSVSVSPSNELHYAALLPGPSKAYGTEPFSGEVPRMILELIKGASTA